MNFAHGCLPEQNDRVRHGVERGADVTKFGVMQAREAVKSAAFFKSRPSQGRRFND
jgi:hypothetical protein